MFRIDRKFVKLMPAKNRDRSESGGDNETEEDEIIPVPDTQSAEEMMQSYISEAEEELKQRAQEVLKEAEEKASKQAKEIIKKAEKEAVAIREAAKENGYKEGYAEGERVFEGRLEQEREKDETALKDLLDEISREMERINSVTEETAVTLSLEIVRKIFNPAEEELGNVFLSLIKNAFRQISSDSKFIIRVAPNEYERYFSSGAASIQLDSGATVTATVLRDISLEEGGLIIDTEDMTINAGLDTQLENIKITFERANQYEPE